MKKLLLTLGSAAAVVAPMATVVACNEVEYKNLITLDFEGDTLITEDIEDIIDGIVGENDVNDITVDLSLEEDESDGAYYIMSFDNLNGEDENYGTILFNIENLPEMYDGKDANGEPVINPDYTTAIDNIVAAVEAYMVI